MVLDTGSIADVPREDRLDEDTGEGVNALDGGDDADLDDVYADSGELVEEDLE